ncbi:hypothetical protein GQ53DRAFT_776478 [Thozetella sp. PMI_491]|nr:hypothetical protein GQ53DRAFT_776478 [Thozetella sp. PMI_491]
MLTLLLAHSVFVTPEEAKTLDGDLWLHEETGLYISAITVVHDLHCVNMIRKFMAPDYYDLGPRGPAKVHIEHCLDALRLSVMCHGDMTPIPTIHDENRGPGGFMPEFRTVHTCRDYQTIREWTMGRDVENPDTRKQHAQKLGSHIV